MTVRILVGDALAMLRTLDAECVQCCVTSPPYYGLRDYGVPGQIGLEPTPEAYAARMVEIFREVRRVLRKDGTLWLNIGDSYSAHAGQRKTTDRAGIKQQSNVASVGAPSRCVEGLGAKQLIGIPWRLAFALQADGWYLRQDIIWAKPNPMPESVRDRCTKAHEYVFLLAKSDRYFYDADAIAEPATGWNGSTFDGPRDLTVRPTTGRKPRGKHSVTDPQASGRRITERVAAARANGADHDSPFGETRNKRSVWEITTKGFAEAHFATMPPELAETCIKAGSAEGQTVLDPFGGAGTTALVADRLQRDATLIELNPEYAVIAEKRVRGDAGMFADVEVA